MLLLVFSYLHHRDRRICRLVCKRWYRRLTPLFWESLNIYQEPHAASFNAPESSLNLGNNIHLIRSFSTSHLDAWKTFITHVEVSIEPVHLPRLAYHSLNPNLWDFSSSLTMQYSCQFYFEQLAQLVYQSLRWLPSLEHLYFTLCLPTRISSIKNYGKEYFDSIVEMQPFANTELHDSSLQVLGIVGNYYSAGIQIWSPLLKACPKLRRLCLTRYQNCDQYLSLAEILQRDCPNLCELELLEGVDLLKLQELDTAQAITSCGPNLTFLDIREISQVGDYSLVAILELSEKLEHLYLPTCVKTTDCYLPSILCSFRKLKTICVDQNPGKYIPASPRSTYDLPTPISAYDLLRTNWVCSELETFSVLVKIPTGLDREESNRLQEEFFQRLGSLHRLRRLCQSVSRGPTRSEFQGYDHTQGTFVYLDRQTQEITICGLDFSRVQNLRHLSSLTELELLDLRSLRLFPGLDGIKWMGNHWPRLNELRLPNHVFGGSIGINELLLRRPKLKCLSYYQPYSVMTQ
ncbi:hypothetical protein BGW38_004010 [Lunasporangiospora selenospora]|uniref:F-box domain-containing protein n=1 Tax=Lunasporangiospora selenospora TaxID=979761 RepID=A0A9P6FQA0_9FUNG|nr:hypothetical protein BGW38_004010 [Lunasporangiospora selenospora]